MTPIVNDYDYLAGCQRMADELEYAGESRDASMLLALSLRHGADLERLAGLARVEPERAVTIARRFLAAGAWRPDGSVLASIEWPEMGTESEIRWHCWVLTGIGAMAPDPEHPGEFKLTGYGRDMAKALVREVAP